MRNLPIAFIGCLILFIAIGKANAQTDSTKKQKQINAVDVNRNKNQITITYADGSSEIMTEQEANKKGLINNGGYGNQQTAKNGGKPVELTIKKPGAAKPVFVLDGQEISEDEMTKIDPKTIESINVLKDKTATDKYGVKGRNGVVEIMTKKSSGKAKDFSVD